MLAPLPELTFAQSIRRIYKVQFMLGMGPLEQLTEPGTLRFGIAGKVEDDGDALRQESTHVWRKRVLQSGRALDESRYIRDLVRK